MCYRNFNGMDLSDEQVIEIKNCIARHFESGETWIDDHETRFVIHEERRGTEKRSLFLRVNRNNRNPRFHFVVVLWNDRPNANGNGRLRLKEYLQEQGADDWRFSEHGIELSVRNVNQGGNNPARGNVFYFGPSDDRFLCRNYSVMALYEDREALGCLAKSILDSLNRVNYFTVDYSNWQ